ncbi:MAG: ribose-phosphate diphosphokinase [Candidatus Aenigmatarchaeota archaeon]
MIVFAPTSIPLARNIAKRLGAKFCRIEINYFPDNEVYIRFKENPKNKDIIIVHSLSENPNEKIIELLFSSLTAKELGAKRILGVIPYLAYMRQDKRFKKGECISAKILPKLIENSGIDAVFTLNPHLHRIKSLTEIFSIPVFELSCGKEIGEYIKKNFSGDWVLVGPDTESRNLIRNISETSGLDYIVLRKKRIGPKKVKILPSKIRISKRNAIIIDDMTSTGETIIETIKELKKHGFKKFFCIVIHLISEDFLIKVKKYCKAISTNSVQTKVSKIDVSEVFSYAIKRYLTQKPIREIDELF